MNIVKKIYLNSFFLLLFFAIDTAYSFDFALVEPLDLRIAGSATGQHARLQGAGGRVYTLTSVGIGMASFEWWAYVTHEREIWAQLFVSHPNAFTRTEVGALRSISNMNAVALKLGFVDKDWGGYSEGGFVSALKVGLEENTSRRAIRRPPYDEFLRWWTQEGISKMREINPTEILIVGEHVSTGEEIIFIKLYSPEKPSIIKQFQGPNGFIRDIFSIWLGRQYGDYFENLKPMLVHGF